MQQTMSVDTNTGTVAKDETQADSRKQFRHTHSGGRKPHRSKLPNSFRDWPAEDQLKYHETSLFLRLAKASQRQCQYIRHTISFWGEIKRFFKSPPVHKRELVAFRDMRQNYKFIDKKQSVDLPPFP